MIFHQLNVIFTNSLEFYIFCWNCIFDVDWGNIKLDVDWGNRLFKAVNSITICIFPATMVGMALSFEKPSNYK
jgi:hypothetical protein